MEYCCQPYPSEIQCRYPKLAISKKEIDFRKTIILGIYVKFQGISLEGQRCLNNPSAHDKRPLTSSCKMGRFLPVINGVNKNPQNLREIHCIKAICRGYNPIYNQQGPNLVKIRTHAIRSSGPVFANSLRLKSMTEVVLEDPAGSCLCGRDCNPCASWLHIVQQFAFCTEQHAIIFIS